MGFLVLLILSAAIWLIYKLLRKVDRLLEKNRRKSLVVKEPETDEEKKQATTALRLYGKDETLPILLCRQLPEGEEKHDKIMIVFFLAVMFIVVAAIGLIFALL